jgi:hypothetical protein
VGDQLREGTSLTEIEIQEGVLRSKEKVYAYFYFRSRGMKVLEDFKEKSGSEGERKLQQPVALWRILAHTHQNLSCPRLQCSL